MDFRDSPEEATFRAEVRAFLAEHAPPGGLRFDAHDLAAQVPAQRAWQRVLFEHGWAVPAWPREWGGRGLTPAQQVIWRQECTRAKVGEGVLTGGLRMLGPTLIAHGSEEQKARFLEPTARGDIVWCQLFSEPGAGSDLASLATRAERRGEEWVVNGQKVWSSYANHADWGFALVRTDPKRPKHQGIGFLLVDMGSPGVEVRPLIEMTGGNHFNEVFFDDVVVPDAYRVGPPDGGWAVARTTLMYERSSIGAFSALEPVERVMTRVREQGGTDAVTADEIARLYTWARGLDLLNARVLTALSHGRMPGAESSVMKNAIAEVWIRAGDLGMRLLGHDALLAEGPFQHPFLFAPSMHIGGGTSEIMKNLVAEQVLGLPREPDPRKDTPFDELPRS